MNTNNNNSHPFIEIIREKTSFIPLEAVLWSGAIGYLAFSNPYNPNHFTLYPPTLLFGIKSPGYNLGHSISLFFHGKFSDSFHTHPLGIFAVIIITSRIIYLLYSSNRKK